MNLKDRAKLFAINAHMGQIRKSEPDKPMIMHPIGVGMLLEEYGYDEKIVAAGYLHDVVEDTKYTIFDIKKEFGDEVANLVMSATEPDKSLSWEERKTHTIENTKELPLCNKLVICADKINNLEDLMLKFGKNGNRDFSSFKRGEEKQKWYYKSIYESLIYNEDKDLPIFKRLKNVLDVVFDGKEDLYLKNTIFDDNYEYYEKLKKLHAQKQELQKLKALCSLPKTFVVEFTGTPRTGKTTVMNNLYDFFKKGGFDVSIVKEFTTSKYYKETIKDELSKMSPGDRNIAIVEYVCKQLQEAVSLQKEIIFIDRSINDRQIWNYQRYLSGDIPLEKYSELKEKYSEISKELIDFLVITYTDSLTSVKRDYNSSLALEKRSYLNTDNVDKYNECLDEISDFIRENVEESIFLDTTNMDMNEFSVSVASKMMFSMRKKYIKTFSKKYNLK